MTRESTDTDTAEQVIDSFRILAGDKVRNNVIVEFVGFYKQSVHVQKPAVKCNKSLSLAFAFCKVNWVWYYTADFYKFNCLTFAWRSNDVDAMTVVLIALLKRELLYSSPT